METTPEITTEEARKSVFEIDFLVRGYLEGKILRETLIGNKEKIDKIITDYENMREEYQGNAPVSLLKGLIRETN